MAPNAQPDEPSLLCYTPAMPTHDFPPRRLRREVGGRSFTPGFQHLAWAALMKRRRRKPGKDPDQGGVPDEPDRPRNLTGGAAAELDFEDE